MSIGAAAEEEWHLSRNHVLSRHRAQLPLDRKLGGMERQALDEAAEPRRFGHIDKEIID
jgi:hypothetical protein